MFVLQNAVKFLMFGSLLLQSYKFRELRQNEFDFYVFDHYQEDVLNILTNSFYELPDASLSVGNKTLRLAITNQTKSQRGYEYCKIFREFLKVNYYETEIVGEYFNQLQLQLKWNKFDMATTTVDYYRQFGILSLFPIVNYEQDVVFRTPEYILPVTFFLKVFTVETWLCFLASVVLAIIFLLFYTRVCKHKIDHFFKSVYHIFGISSEVLENPRISFHIGHTVVALLSFIFATCFSAFLVSELSETKIKLPFSTLNELMTIQNEYQLCYSRHILTHFYDQLEKYHYQSRDNICPPDIRKETLMEDSLEINKIMCNNPRIAYFDYAHMFDIMHYSTDKLCDISRMHQNPFKKGYILAIGSKFQYRNQFNVMLVKLRTTGIMAHIDANTDTVPEDLKLLNERNDFLEISLAHLQVIFGIFFVGVLLAVIFFAFEILFKQCLNYSSRSRANTEANTEILVVIEL